jgi:hypothetical protein
MSIGIDSLMAMVDMRKLLDRETLEKYRLVKKETKSHNLQIGEVIDAISQTEPELFGKSTAVLMPVNHVDRLDIPICDSRLNNLRLDKHGR